MSKGVSAPPGGAAGGMTSAMPSSTLVPSGRLTEQASASAPAGAGPETSTARTTWSPSANWPAKRKSSRSRRVPGPGKRVTSSRVISVAAERLDRAGSLVPSRAAIGASSAAVMRWARSWRRPGGKPGKGGALIAVEHPSGWRGLSTSMMGRPVRFKA